ncbi:hypothetical protein GH714_009752 [Hevea brasiliensis]|uniref:Uncharacterized protein n=1 Tax=Hevea brasiliensis TaxID=3981 RepID=A0A6A6N266_HEVBR|nr:hypothetical protein GH714_009752 [Hevea brasiliensis]
METLWETALVQHGTKEDAAQAICDFLANFNEQDPSKNTRKFQFHFINGSVVLAIIAPNNKLHLDFSSGKQEIHRQFKLQLEFNNPQNFACSCSQPSPSLSAFSVKSLHLISVNHLTNDAVSSMLKNFIQGPKSNSFSSCDFDSVLLAIKNVKVLTLCKWTFQALICPSLSTFLAEFQFYNLEELWWIDNSEQEYDSDPLISFLKLCPSLERLFVTIDPKSYCVERAATCSIQAGEVVTCEPLILASADGICLRKLIDDPLYQPKQQSHERKCSYKSVEVKDMNMLCPKHVHMADIMKSLNIPKGIRRVLFRTLNTHRGLMFKPKFDTSFAGFTVDGAKWLVENTDIKLVGIDYLSVGVWSEAIPTHLIFLESRQS